MNIKFKKFGLSQTDVQQMREYGILPDKKTLQNLIKAYYSNNPEIDDIAQLQDNLGCRIDEDYIQFLLKHNGGIPSKVRIKGNKIVIDHFCLLNLTISLTPLLIYIQTFNNMDYLLQIRLPVIVLFYL